MDLFTDDHSPGSDSIELLRGDSSAVLYSRAIATGDAARHMEELLHAVPWQQRQVTVFGKQHPQPRLVAWFGEPETTYTYAGLTLEPLSWTPAILELKRTCDELANTVFNSVLLNLYRDGEDTVGWHSDDEPELGTDPVIASVTLGATRRFDFRHKRTRETIKALLPAGSILVMSGRTQEDWSHQLPRTKKVGAPRINLTFRRIHR